MPRPNAAESYLHQAAGTVPEVLRGPDGAAFYDTKLGWYLVMRKGLFHPDRPDEDTVKTKEIWTNTLARAQHLVDRRIPVPPCGCKKCKRKMNP